MACRSFLVTGPINPDVYRRVQDIEAAMASKFNSCQVIPYIQIHEFEAFVFVDLDLLKSQFPDGGATKAAAVLRAEMGDFRPEQIDDGPQTAPSKRLLRVLPGYNKVTNGPAIAKAIGLERLRKACPHFGDWLDRLETLAGAKV